MTAPNLSDHYRQAILVDSLWGGNSSAFVFHEQGAPIGRRLELPKSTGNPEKDNQLWHEITEGIEGWKQTGEFPENILQFVS